ncbi:acetyltransferase [Bacillus mycoides]|uniref:acetyltransferase n=1 Tax=Bacillus mycoides TaxID=1405 RepID=UPI001C00E600|nr:acetyltransferase [Bacillus mycoides]QWI53137.1 acetyltransferase [Bacillus mycoides]QWI89768.1 acetyltransferase [Bacillus mycoides]
MKKPLLIIGAGGHGKVIADIALKMNEWKYIAFLDDNEDVKTSMGIEIIDKSTSASKYIKEYDLFVGIGNNTIRKKVQEQLEDQGAIIPVLIHPSAIIGEQVYLEAGTVVMAGAIINCCTKIGKGCIINTASTIDHDNIIEDYVHISPGAHLAGTVKVGSGTWLAIGSVVINNINITNECKIGAGAVVIRDITETGTYVGVPAKRIDE